MGALPGQTKGEFYEAQWTFMRTWIPEPMRCVTDLLDDERFASMWHRAKELQERPKWANPEPDAIRRAIVEMFDEQR